MLYGPFGTQSSMVTFIFTSGLRTGQYQVKIGQVRPNYRIQNVVIKTYLSSLLSLDAKKSSIFMYENYEYQKLRFKKVL